MGGALDAHDATLREAIESHRGWLFKHTGDGVCAVFSSPRSAVRRRGGSATRTGVAGAHGHRHRRSRTAWRRLLRRRAQSGRTRDGLRSRWPDPARRPDRWACFGVTNWSASAPSSCATSPTPIEIFQVRAPGLNMQFPPLKTSIPHRATCAHAPPAFVGRESELTELEATLREHRLVTLTGDGWGGQDAARLGGRRTVGPRFRRRGVGDRARRGRRPGCGARSRGRHLRNHPAAGDVRNAKAWRPLWTAARDCWCSTTASTSSMPPPR